MLRKSDAAKLRVTPEPADKALAPDRLLQDKAADRRAAGKAEADHGRLQA